MASTFQYAQATTGIQNPFSSTMCGHIIAKKIETGKNGSKNF
jgi:hypothetical protein